MIQAESIAKNQFGHFVINTEIAFLDIFFNPYLQFLPRRNKNLFNNNRKNVYEDVQFSF